MVELELPGNEPIDYNYVLEETISNPSESEEEKQKAHSPVEGRKVNREGNVVDENGDLIAKLTELPHYVAMLILGRCLPSRKVCRQN